MTINKYQGRTQEEAIRIAKEQLGENAVIMNVRPIKSKGLFHFLKDSAYEVTAAVEEQQPVAKSSGLAIQDNINFLRMRRSKFRSSRRRLWQDGRRTDRRKS